MTSTLPAAVLWDMDGTIVDTEGYWMAAETALVESHGGSWSHEQALELVGNGLENSAEILQRAGVSLSVPEIIAHLSDEVTTQLRERGNPMRPGAGEMLTALRAAGVRQALVTMSLRSMAEQVAAGLGDDVFDVIVAGDEVTRPKPFADPYLQACAALGVEPKDAVAIEDSPTGVAAAVAAGVVTVGVPLMVSLDDSAADALWTSLDGRSVEDLSALLASRREQEVAR